jgi:hypothetical protein
VPVPRINGLWLQTLSDREDPSAAERGKEDDFAYRILYAPAWNRLPDSLWKNLRPPCKVLFFSIKPPVQIHPPAGGWPAGSSMFIVTPLHAAVRPSS